MPLCGFLISLVTVLADSPNTCDDQTCALGNGLAARNTGRAADNATSRGVTLIAGARA